MGQLLRRFRGDERGEGVTEYALIVAMVAVCLVGVIQVMRNEVGGLLNTAAAGVEQSSGESYGGSGGGAGGGGVPRVFPGPSYGGGPTGEEDPGESPDSAAVDSAGGSTFAGLGAR